MFKFLEQYRSLVDDDAGNTVLASTRGGCATELVLYMACDCCAIITRHSSFSSQKPDVPAEAPPSCIKLLIQAPTSPTKTSSVAGTHHTRNPSLRPNPLRHPMLCRRPRLMCPAAAEAADGADASCVVLIYCAVSFVPCSARHPSPEAPSWPRPLCRPL